MPSDTSEHVPATLADHPGPEAIAVTRRPTAGDPRGGTVAPPTTPIVVAPEPVMTVAPAIRPNDDVVDALERLREALVSTGRSLDRVAATIPGAGPIPGVGPAAGVTRSPAR